jgi:hypothetical protein
MNLTMAAESVEVRVRNLNKVVLGRVSCKKIQ